MKILVAYATVHNSSAEVAEFIGRVLRTYDASVEVDVRNVREVTNLADYDVYILGSAIHGGMWLREMSIFTRQNRDQLAKHPAFFWITCIRALEDDGRDYARQYYFDPEIVKALQVRDTAVFTGKLRTDAITREELWYLAAHYDGRQTPGIIKDDFRDWGTIAAWAHSIAKNIGLRPVFQAAQETNPGTISAVKW